MYRAPKSLVSPDRTHSFLVGWSERKLPLYIAEYGGERAGVPKGEDIPFPRHKVQAAMELLAYGSPKHETLTTIARTVRVSSALLRVWRTERRFLTVYRRDLWECADDFIQLLASSWQEQRHSPSEEFCRFFGVVLQHAILQRLCADVLRMVPEWIPLGLTPKWLSEYRLVENPPKRPSSFSEDEIRLLKLNTSMLLSTNLQRLGTREPGLERWASMMAMHDLMTETFLQKDLREEAERCGCDSVMKSINFITSQPAMDRYQALFRHLHLANKEKRSR